MAPAMEESSSVTGSEDRLPRELSGKNRESFAFPTLRDRVPVIICKVIDLLHRQRLQLGLKDPDALKASLEKMAKLRYELQTNKPLLPIADNRPDQEVWNRYLEDRKAREGQPPRWFDTCWMFAECYAYRRLLESVAASPELCNLDFFASQKLQAFRDNLEAIDSLLETLEQVLGGGKKPPSEACSPDALSRDFRLLLETSLWGNRCDLSISAGDKQTVGGVDEVAQFRKYLLVDHATSVWEYLIGSRLRRLDNKVSAGGSSGGPCRQDIVVDMVLDNAAFELFSDLCLADFLVSTGLADRMRLRVKAHPWFISDTTVQDVEWLLSTLREGAVTFRQKAAPDDCVIKARIERMRRISAKWSDHLVKGTWDLRADPFWTYPHDYSQLKRTDPELYESLSQATLIIFKGDLNYRKLVGDLDWPPTTPFFKALQDFHPAPIAALRTLKADVVAGLEQGQAEQVSQEDPDWMVNGKWGLIQFCPGQPRDSGAE